MADAKDCSLDELLAEISNLSLNSDCSKATKETKVRLDVG